MKAALIILLVFCATFGKGQTYYADSLSNDVKEKLGGNAVQKEILVRTNKKTCQSPEFRGRIMVTFDVDTFGKVGPILMDYDCPDHRKDIEKSIRMLTWQPGIQDGRKVAVRYTVPARIEMW